MGRNSGVGGSHCLQHGLAFPRLQRAGPGCLAGKTAPPQASFGHGNRDPRHVIGQIEQGAPNPVEQHSGAPYPQTSPNPSGAYSAHENPTRNPQRRESETLRWFPFTPHRPSPKIRIDGRHLGNTPLLDFKIPVGEYRVVLRYKLNPPLDTLIFFRPGNNGPSLRVSKG